MPIDPDVPALALRGMQQAQPFDLSLEIQRAAVAQAARAKAQQAMEDRRQQQAYQQRLQQLGQQYGNDYDGLVKAVSSEFPEQGIALSEAVGKARYAGAQAHLEDLKVADANIDEGARMMATANADNWPAIRDYWVKKAPELDQVIDPQYSDDAKQRAQQLAIGLKDWTDLQRKATETFLKGDYQTAAAQLYAGADTPQKRAVIDGQLDRAGLSAFSQIWPDQASAQKFLDTQTPEATAKPEKLIATMTGGLTGAAGLELAQYMKANGITDPLDPRLKGKINEIQRREAQARHITVQTAATGGTQSDINEQADMLAHGQIVPSLMSRRAGSFNTILARANEISKKETGRPLNLLKAEADFNAAKRWAGTMNGNQMIRFKGLANSVVNTIDEVKRLSDELQQGGIQKWNAAKRGTILQVYGNSPQSATAAQYVAAVNTLKEEFANLATGGFAPTDAAWNLANGQINGDYGVKDLNASLTEVQRLINYRLGGFEEIGPISPYGGPAMTPAQAPAGAGRVEALRQKYKY